MKSDEPGSTDGATASEINGLLDRWRAGDRSAYDRLITLLHGELQRLAHLQFARERRNHTLETQDLVSKLYLKLLPSKTVPWRDHTHFLNSALRAMRQIMIDHARTWAKRADGRDRASLTHLPEGPHSPGRDSDHELTQLMMLDQAIEQMAEQDEAMAHIADLRLVLGLTLEETASELNLPINKVKRDWLSIRNILAEKVWKEQST